MKTQDRAVVKALLQYMTEKCLTGSTEFRAALKHFDITTTYMGRDIEQDDSIAKLLGIEHNHFVDVFYASRIDTAPHGERFKFKAKEEAVAFAARERTVGDARVNTLVLNARELNAERLAQNVEAAHAEALEMDAANDKALVAFADECCLTPFEIKFHWEEVHTEALDMNERRNQSIRAVIARAIHVGANSFGHVIGEHEELVETLRNAGYPDAADKVDPVIDAIGGENHKVIRSSWLEALRKVSAAI